MKCHKRLTLDIWILVAYVLDITSGGIQHHRPIDGYKSFVGTGTAHLRTYVASGSPPGQYGGAHHGLQQQLSYQQPPSQQNNPAGKFEEPYFDDTTPRNVTGLVGKSAYLSCRVKNLGNKTVSWIRHRDIHILTVGSYTYTSDQRFQATHHKNIDDWTLQIKWAQKRDAGIYECQISTQPVRSFFVTLSVVVPTATIIGGPDLHVDKGSTINLTCAVKYSPEPPAYIFWYHHDEVISYDSSRGGVSVITEKGDVTTSHLLIQNADLDDSGKYSCSPSNADVASVRVHVLNGEHPEAMQTGDGTAVVPYDVRLLLLLAALLALLLPAISPSCTAEGAIVSVCPEELDRRRPHPQERNSSARNPAESCRSTSRNRRLDGSYGDGGCVASGSDSSTIDRHRSVRCDSVR